MGQFCGKSWDELGPSEREAAVRGIVQGSSSEKEVRWRLKEECGYSGSLFFFARAPIDAGGLDGLVMKNGAFALIMLEGNEGPIAVGPR